MDLILGIRVVRFRANNAGIMRARPGDRYIKAADVAEAVGVAKTVAIAKMHGESCNEAELYSLNLVNHWR
jgi:hypothetical protein